MNKKDLTWIEEVFRNEWSGDFVVSRGKKHYPKGLLGLIAEETGKKVGLLTYEIINDQIEITSLNSFQENRRIGSSLVKHLIKLAKTCLLYTSPSPRD